VIGLRSRPASTVLALGSAQTLAWGSSYYLPAILADPISAGLGISRPLFFGFFSASLLLQAMTGRLSAMLLIGAVAGVLVLSNLVLGAGLF
jgi:hypothetical protein